MSEELLPYSAAQRQNRLLLESENLDPYDDGFTRKNAGGGGGAYQAQPSLMARSQKPLIEEERPEPESQPYFMRRPKANAAKQIYDRKQAEKNPWKMGMPYSQATLNMFGGFQNPKAAARAGRPGGFEKLFGAKMSEAELDERQLAGRAPKKSLWQRLKHAVTGGGRKRSWMEMFFGARRRGQGTSMASMGVTSTNAPHGESSGWADKLIDASKAGRLDEGGDEKDPFLSDPQLVAQDQNQSFEHYDPNASREEEKQAKGVNFFQQQVAQQQLLNGASETNDYGVGQKNNYGDAYTNDDNSQDNDNEYGNGNLAGGGMLANGDYNRSMVDNYMHNGDDDDSSQSPDEDDAGEALNPMQKFLLDQIGAIRPMGK